MYILISDLVLTVTSLKTPRMRRMLRKECRGRTRNPFTKKSFQTGSSIFDDMSMELFLSSIIGGSSSSRLVVLDRPNAMLETFGGKLKAGAVLE